MLSKIFLILFLAYLVNKVLIIPFKKEWNSLFGSKSAETEDQPKEKDSSLLRNEDIEDAEFKDLKD